MPEHRRDPHLGLWVLIAPERRDRPRPRRSVPATPAAEDPACPFCEGREGMTPPETEAVRPGGSAPDGPGWRARAVPNKYPAIASEATAAPGPPAPGGALLAADFGELSRAAAGGGAHEVLIDAPAHTQGLADLPDDHAAEVLLLLQRRTRALFGRPGVRAVFTFKNHGLRAGASIEHSHLQILALPFLPEAEARRRANAARFLAESGRALLEAVAEEELKAGARIVEAGEEGALVWCPFAPRFPWQLSIAPWPPLESFAEAPPAAVAAAGRALARALRRLKNLLGDPAVNATFHIEARDGTGPEAHRWHIEVAPRLVPLAGLEIGSGVHIVEVPPEEAAGKLRDALQGEQR